MNFSKLISRKYRNYYTIQVALCFLMLSFNNCSGKGFVVSGVSENASSLLETPEIIFTSNNPAVINTDFISVTFSVNLLGATTLQSLTCQLDANAPTDCSSRAVYYTGLNDADHTLNVKAQTNTGVNSEAMLQFRKDSAAPSLSVSSAPPAVTGATSAIFQFTASDNLSGVGALECSLDNAAFALCVSPKSLTALSAGDHNFRIRASDVAGNMSAVYSANWNVDLTAPVLSLTSTPPAFSNSGSASFGFSSASAVSYECQLDGAAFTVCVSPKAYSALSAAAHTFNVRAKDAAGNTSSPVAYAWTIDMVAPTTPTLMANVPAVTKLKAASFTFSATDASSGIASYSCSVDAAAFAPCASPKTLNALADGDHTFKVKALDNATNSSLESSFAWKVDSINPVLVFTATPSSTTTGQTAAFSFTASDANAGLSLVQCSLDTAAFANCTSPVNLTGLSYASHTFRVQAQDNAGNANLITYSWTISAALPLPVITALSASPASIASGASSTISWATTGATSLTLAGVAVTGTSKVVTPAATTIFTLTASNATGSVNATVTVTVSGGSSPTFIFDKRLMPIPQAGVYPTKGVTITDPSTGFRVTRIADKSELVGDYANYKPPMSIIVYSRYTASNTTGEYTVVHGDNSTSAWLYRNSDNKMLIPLKFNPNLGNASRSLGELNEIRWDYSGQHPYRMYFVGRSLASAGVAIQGEKIGMSFYYLDFDPATNTQSAPVLIKDFSSSFPNAANAEILNDVEGDSSIDSRYWAWQVVNTSLPTGNKTYAIFSYDQTTNQILGSIQQSCAGAPVPCVAVSTPSTAAPYISRPNMVEMSPLGTRVHVNWGRAYAGNRDADIGTVADGPRGFLPNFSDPIRIAADETHSGWAWGANGEELFISQNNRNDYIEAVDIKNATTANCQVISGNSYTCGTQVISYVDVDGGDYTLGMHFGKVYDKNKKGWLFMNTYDAKNTTYGKNQNLFVEIKPRASNPRIWRLGSSYNQYYDYRSEGSGALDFKGENVYTTGNWGFVDGRGDAIRIELPTNWYNLLGQ